MPSIHSKIDATEKHVPAWKKLGLKLKYAKDEPEAETNGNQPIVQNEKKRKHISDETTSSTKTYPKKLKAKSSSNSASIEHSAVTTSSPQEISHFQKSSLSPSTSNAPTTPTRPVLKRKSVTFTPETKTEDGDSIKQLYNTWLASHRVIDPSFDPSATTISPALKSVLLPSITFPSAPSPSAVLEQKSKAKKKKKKKKSKSKSTLLSKNPEPQPSQKQTQASPTPTVKDDQICTYITTHHLSRSSWKFSKSRQNALLRSAFSLSAIPSLYDSALLSYLCGLQGAAAKSRVRKMALQIRAEDEEWLKGLEPSEKDKARRRAEYEGAVKRAREMLERKEELREEQLAHEEWETRFRKRRRAEVVLWGIGEEEENKPQPLSMARNTDKNKDTQGENAGTPNRNPTTTTTVKPPTNLARNGKPKRKRKAKVRKTGVPDDDETSSSSSPSSSSSNSSSSSDDDDDGDGRTGVMLKKAIWDEDTSSDEGSSSGSSEEEEEEEEEEEGSGDEDGSSSSGDDSSGTGSSTESGTDDETDS